MNCRNVIDRVFLGEEPLPLFTRVQIGIHILFCPRCQGGLEKLETACRIMRNDFFPPSPGMEESVMAQILAEVPPWEKTTEDAVSGGVSTRSWVITGFIMLFSLVSSFFGRDFIKVANAQGASFLLPMGITIGLVLTCYGALFIASHLEELAVRFKLR